MSGNEQAQYELAQQVMDDDGAGSAITSIPAGQSTPEPKPFSAEFDRLYTEYLGAGGPGSWQRWLAALAGRPRAARPGASR